MTYTVITVLQATWAVETAAHCPNKTDTTLRNLFHRWRTSRRGSFLHPITWHPVLDHHVIQTLGMMERQLCVFVPPISARAVISFNLRPLFSPVPVALRGRMKPTAGLHAVWRCISVHAGNRSPLTDHTVRLLITVPTQLTLLSLQCQTRVFKSFICSLKRTLPF